MNDSWNYHQLSSTIMTVDPGFKVSNGGPINKKTPAKIKGVFLKSELNTWVSQC